MKIKKEAKVELSKLIEALNWSEVKVSLIWSSPLAYPALISETLLRKSLAHDKATNYP